MDKIYVLPNSAVWRFKFWPALITLCCLFLIWAFEATLFSIFFAGIVSIGAWWRSAYVPHLITLRDDGRIQFKSFLKEIEIHAEDIQSIVENTYYREIAVFCPKGRIAVPFCIFDIMNFIDAVRQINPNIVVKLGKLTRSLK